MIKIPHYIYSTEKKYAKLTLKTMGVTDLIREVKKDFFKEGTRAEFRKMSQYSLARKGKEKHVRDDKACKRLFGWKKKKKKPVNG